MLKTLLGRTRRRLLRIFSSNGRRQGQTDVCSSRLATIEMVVTIVGARYPELDTFQNDVIQFGNYLQGEQCTRGGFLPIFWDAPYSYVNASTDIGDFFSCIAGQVRDMVGQQLD